MSKVDGGDLRLTPLLKCLRKFYFEPSSVKINPRSLERGVRGVKLTHPLDFFGFKFLLLDRLSKALAQLFLVCQHIF